MATKKAFMKGNEAIAEAAIQAGCRYFFGYPITPQNQIPEYMSKRLPKIGGTFLQAESEVAAINLVSGAAGAGARVMTSSSSPGISLKQEGISYIAGAELPCVIVNIVRAGPGLGGIQAAQCDYFQAAKGGGHGDYRMPVYLPATVQEAVDLMTKAFDVADRYRTPVLVMGDGMLGQMMEPVVMEPQPAADLPAKDWAATGWDGKSRERAVINSLYLQPDALEAHNRRLQEKYAQIEQNECLVETTLTDDAEIVLVAYGTVARIAGRVMEDARAQGVKVGLIRPITAWPFPYEAISAAAKQACTKAFLTVEMSAGQMIEDVRLAVEGRKPVHFHGRMGGMNPDPRQILEQIMAIKGGM